MVGALRGIAPDEQIQAVRFLGEVGYVVTFEQVDPLFTIDLSDPTAPRELGRALAGQAAAELGDVDGAIAVWLEGAHLDTMPETDRVLLLQEATKAGTSFAFGYIGGGDPPFAEPFPGAGFILAFQALPIILVMSALSALLTYWRVLPALVRLFSGLFQKT